MSSREANGANTSSVRPGMNISHEPWLEEMPFEECLQLLREESIGRIAFLLEADDSPIVWPVNYRLVETSGPPWLALRTRPGSPIDHTPMNVAFEIDSADPVHRQGWSVLVRGTLLRVDPDAADFRARFDPEPWVVSERDRWLTVEPFSITGRRLHPAEREWAFDRHAYV
jgi:nitroimidazol reductase NimA-like FMN-containing flavoprotein (pyridoxamine 5'-phosphate oxidase superfamily)